MSRYPLHRPGCRISHDGPCPTEADVARMDAHEALDTAIEATTDRPPRSPAPVAGETMTSVEATARMIVQVNGYGGALLRIGHLMATSRTTRVFEAWKRVGDWLMAHPEEFPDAR